MDKDLIVMVGVIDVAGSGAGLVLWWARARIAAEGQPDKTALIAGTWRAIRHE